MSKPGSQSQELLSCSEEISLLCILVPGVMKFTDQKNSCFNQSLLPCSFSNETNFIGMDHFISKMLTSQLIFFTFFPVLHLDSLNTTRTKTLKA